MIRSRRALKREVEDLTAERRLHRAALASVLVHHGWPEGDPFPEGDSLATYAVSRSAELPSRGAEDHAMRQAWVRRLMAQREIP